MAFDSHPNLVMSAILIPPSPADSGTSLTVSLGDGTLFSSFPFNCVVWPAGVLALLTNSEIIRVTGVSGDTLTIVRQQEGTSARSILIGDQIAVVSSKKVFTDIENAIGSAVTGTAGIATIGNGADSGSVTGLGLTFTPTKVTLQILRPTGGLILIACANNDLTSDGFSYELSGITDSANYKLNYVLFP